MGSLYYNTEADRFEGLFKTGTSYTWNTLGGVIDNDQDTHIVAQKNNTDLDTLFFTANSSEVMTITEDSLHFNPANSTGSNMYINANKLSVTAILEVGDSLIASSNLDVTKETTLKSTLSVSGSSTFDSDIRMNENQGVLLLPQYTSTAYVSRKTNDNEGSIVYDTQNGIFLGLSQPDGGLLDWRPIGGGGLQDADGDTKITAETSFGSDQDTLTFITSGDTIATMSNDKVEIRKNLSVSSPVNIESTLSVNGNTRIIGNTHMTGSLSVSGATNLDSTLSVLGISKFEDNVTIAKNKKLYSETTLTNKLGHYDNFNENGESLGDGSLNMYYENVFIHGNLDIAGSINQSSTQVDELFIEDKSIVLGVKSTNSVLSNVDGSQTFLSSNYLVKETEMNQAGLTLSGLPDKFATDSGLRELYSNDIRFEKSILWKLPETNDSGTSNLAITSRNDDYKSVEPFWEIKGGHLRLTTNTADHESKFVSFAFRINSKEQLELVKIKNNGTGTGDFKTIAKFGSIVSA